MAAEQINITAALGFSSSSIQSVARSFTGTFTPTGGRYFGGTQRLTTTPAAIDLGGISSIHWVIAKNLDATNNALLRAATGAADTITLKPGECCVYPSTTSTPFGSSSASTVDLEYIVVEA